MMYHGCSTNYRSGHHASHDVFTATCGKGHEDNPAKCQMTGPSMEPFHQACFDVLSRVVANIPEPPEPSLMLRQGIAVGGLVAADPLVRQALYATQS